MLMVTVAVDVLLFTSCKEPELTVPRGLKVTTSGVPIKFGGEAGSISIVLLIDPGEFVLWLTGIPLLSSWAMV
jgi:hypothetical protein